VHRSAVVPRNLNIGNGNTGDFHGGSSQRPLQGSGIWNDSTSISYTTP
jgi:hypothetical protein